MSSQVEIHSKHESAVERLAQEFTGVFSRETVAAVFEEILPQFADTPITKFTTLLALRNAREHLRTAARSHVVSERTRMLFVCRDSVVGQLAAALVKERVGRAVDAQVAGPPPDAVTSRLVDDLVTGIEPRPATFPPMALTTELVHSSSVVVTVQRGNACVVLQGRRYFDWGLDPLDAIDSDTLRTLSDDLHRRIEHLLSSI